MALPFLLALPVAVETQMQPCLAVQEDRIYGRDVAVAVPAFSAFPEGFALSYAPVPGVRRVLSGSYLQRAAKNHGLEMESLPDVCFERPLTELPGDGLTAAMHAAFEDGPKTDSPIQIEVRQWGPRTAPQGTVVFPLAGIQAPLAAERPSEVLWRGYVLYGETHHFPVWARARVSVMATRVVAVDDIPAGKPIQPDQVRLETAEAYVLDTRPVRHLDEVVGFLPRNFIRSGTSVLRSELSRAPEVTRGDLVKVQVHAGAAQLFLEGRAQTSGTTGSPIWVKNLSSGKQFRATVAGKGTATIEETPVKEQLIQ